MNKNKKAFTLIEVLIALGIAAIVAAAAYFTYNAVRATQIANEEVRNLEIIRTNIRTLYASQRDYNGVNTELLTLSGWVKDGGLNSYSNPYAIVGQGDGPGVPSKSFMMSTKIPRKACEKVAQGLAASWDHVRIGGTNNIVKAWNSDVINSTVALNSCANWSVGTETVGISIESR